MMEPRIRAAFSGTPQNNNRRPGEVAGRPWPYKPHPVDAHVGARIRAESLMLRLTQPKMGDAMGAAFNRHKSTNAVRTVSRVAGWDECSSSCSSTRQATP